MAIATGSETWYASPAGSKRISAPRTNVIPPATVSAPWVGHERLGDEERGREQHQEQPRERHRQHLEPVQAEDQRDRADRPGEDQAGVPELDDDPDAARSRA